MKEWRYYTMRNWFSKSVIVVTLMATTCGCQSHSRYTLKPVAFRLRTEHLITRDIDDKAYSCIIHSYNGWERTKKRYGLNAELPYDICVNSRIVVGLNDNITERLNGFWNGPASYTYFLDYVQTGIKYKLRGPESGKKHTYVTIVTVPRPFKAQHVGVRQHAEGLSRVVK